MHFNFIRVVFCRPAFYHIIYNIATFLLKILTLLESFSMLNSIISSNLYLTLFWNSLWCTWDPHRPSQTVTTLQYALEIKLELSSWVLIESCCSWSRHFLFRLWHGHYCHGPCLSLVHLFLLRRLLNRHLASNHFLVFPFSSIPPFRHLTFSSSIFRISLQATLFMVSWIPKITIVLSQYKELL